MNRQPPTRQPPPPETDPSTFAFAVIRIASAQICQSVGFTSARRSALNTLSDVAATYLRALARSASASAALSGRTQPNLHDVVLALDDLAASAHGFPGAWDPRRPRLASAALADLSSFVELTEEIPFAKPLPRPLPPPSNFTAKRTGQASHVPRWLPPFPEVGEKREIGGEEREKEEEERIGKIVDGGGLVDEKMKVGLLEKRGRVRFKIGFCVGKCKCEGGGGGGGEVREGFVGVDLRSRVCRGGKRVSCHQNRNVDNNEGGGGVHRKKRRRKSSSNWKA